MSHAIAPQRLLRQAKALAGTDAGPGRPIIVNHRRAVSAAYYALFHEICLETVRYALPVDAREAEIHDAVRWFDHKDVRGVCQLIALCGGSAFNGSLPRR